MGKTGKLPQSKVVKGDTNSFASCVFWRLSLELAGDLFTQQGLIFFASCRDPSTCSSVSSRKC